MSQNFKQKKMVGLFFKFFVLFNEDYPFKVFARRDQRPVPLNTEDCTGSTGSASRYRLFSQHRRLYWFHWKCFHVQIIFSTQKTVLVPLEVLPGIDYYLNTEDCTGSTRSASRYRLLSEHRRVYWFHWKCFQVYIII